MRHTRIESPARTLPDRWQVICHNARVLLPLVPPCGSRTGPWRDEVRELRTFGFEEGWDPAAVDEARTHICNYCGNDMDLRVYSHCELGKHTYAYCTMAGCHWWLEF